MNAEATTKRAPHGGTEYSTPVTEAAYKKYLKPHGRIKSHQLACLVCEFTPPEVKSENPLYMSCLKNNSTRLGFVFEILREGMRLGEVMRLDKIVTNPETGEESFTIRIQEGVKWLEDNEVAIPLRIKTHTLHHLSAPRDVNEDRKSKGEKRWRSVHDEIKKGPNAAPPISKERTLRRLFDSNHHSKGKISNYDGYKSSYLEAEKKYGFR